MTILAAYCDGYQVTQDDKGLYYLSHNDQKEIHLITNEGHTTLDLVEAELAECRAYEDTL